MFQQADIENLNTDIEIWGDKNFANIKSEIPALGIQHYPYSRNPKPLAQALRQKLSKRFSLINKISYSMPRSGVFVHKGVSRGHGKNNPRQAKEWFNPVLNKDLDELGDIVAEGQGNLVVNGLLIK
ncbi:MAG TPA: hypothetical protein PL045_10655 [Chitinophagaceae bacterium]|nr:hypothetical protein [Chitinophagaceae bacterium]